MRTYIIPLCPLSIDDPGLQIQFLDHPLFRPRSSYRVRRERGCYKRENVGGGKGSYLEINLISGRFKLKLQSNTR
jgi:hypothetical protein